MGTKYWGQDCGPYAIDGYSSTHFQGVRTLFRTILIAISMGYPWSGGRKMPSVGEGGANLARRAKGRRAQGGHAKAPNSGEPFGAGSGGAN
jgi:hypothetical protein